MCQFIPAHPPYWVSVGTISVPYHIGLVLIQVPVLVSGTLDKSPYIIRVSLQKLYGDLWGIKGVFLAITGNFLQNKKKSKPFCNVLYYSCYLLLGFKIKIHHISSGLDSANLTAQFLIIFRFSYIFFQSECEKSDHNISIVMFSDYIEGI